jgi:peptide/nickel transport system permease protein
MKVLERRPQKPDRQAPVGPERVEERLRRPFFQERFPWLPGLRKNVRRFLRNPLSVTGLALMAFFLLVAILAPWLAPPVRADLAYTIPNDGYSPIPKPPHAEAWNTFPPNWRLHPFGTTEGQYDIYYGIIWGTRTAFRVGLTVVGISLLIGLLVGSISAFFGGLVDELLMRFVDVLLVFPNIILAATLVVVITQHPFFDFLWMKIPIDRLTAAMASFIAGGWLYYARLIRGEILSAKERDYVQAARVLGASNFRTIVRHLLPNTIYPVLIAASLDLGTVVLGVAALSFLGLGPERGYADWGQMINFARNFIIGPAGDPFHYWYVIIIPGATITLFVLAWNLLGDAVRDILDPKLKGKTA